MSYISGAMKFINVMEFIDGGYLRKSIRDKFQHDRINYGSLRDILKVKCAYSIEMPQLIRAYYYDAITERGQPGWEEQSKYFDEIRKLEFFEVKLGRLVKQGDGSQKQKGVDILLAIDMITKAYESHYDVAVLLSGDDDMVDLVKAVKETGKRVYGAFFEGETSKGLINSFDRRFPLEDEVEKFVKPNGNNGKESGRV